MHKENSTSEAAPWEPNLAELDQYENDCEREWLLSSMTAECGNLAAEGIISVELKAFPGEREALLPVAERLLKSVMDFVSEGSDR